MKSPLRAWLLTGVIVFTSVYSYAEVDKNILFPEIGIDKRLGETLNADIAFSDEEGRPVLLKDYLKDKPVILTPVYYECPMLCTLLLNGLVRALNAMTFEVGKEFDVVTFSFDPEETPAMAQAKKKNYLEAYRKKGTEAGWHFLTGTEESIQNLLSQIGYRIEKDKRSGEYAHPSSLVLLSPKGKISSYLTGVEFSTRDLRLALVEASENRIGTLADQAMLFCFQYDPMKGQYSFFIMNIVRITGVMMALMVGLYIAISLKRERPTV